MLAFGSSPSSRAAERKLDAKETTAAAAGVSPDVGAGEVAKAYGSKDAAASTAAASEQPPR